MPITEFFAMDCACSIITAVTNFILPLLPTVTYYTLAQIIPLLIETMSSY